MQTTGATNKATNKQNKGRIKGGDMSRWAYFLLLVKGNAYRLLLMADERSSKEGGEKKIRWKRWLKCSSQSPITGRQMLFAPLTGRRRSPGIFTPILGDFSWQHSFWSGANFTQRRGERGGAVGRRASGPRRWPPDVSEPLNNSCDVSGSLVAELCSGL